MTDREPPIPGTLLLHPVVFLSVAVILFNNEFLKVHHPGFWSGKLSDFGLCVFLPVWLFSCVEWATWATDALRGRTFQKAPGGRATAAASCLIAGAYFTALQVSPAFAAFHVHWLSYIVPHWSFAVTPDLSDLIALPLLFVAYALMVRRLRHTSSPL